MFVGAGGRHAMALTVDGKVFSWGEGEDGKLGHFSRLSVNPQSINLFFFSFYLCFKLLIANGDNDGKRKTL